MPRLPPELPPPFQGLPTWILVLLVIVVLGLLMALIWSSLTALPV